MIIEVIPEVELLIGRPAAVAVVGAAENQNRFHGVFQAFSAVFARQEHPLVIFLDDLQWADIPTLNLIKAIMTSPYGRHLLFIGAYRDNEVEEAHPLAAFWRKSVSSPCRPYFPRAAYTGARQRSGRR